METSIEGTKIVIKINIPFPYRTLHRLLEERKKQNENNRSD